MKYTDHSAFTAKFNGLAGVIITDVTISQVDESDVSKQIKSKAIWDTGATICAITQEYAIQLNLSPIDRTMVNGVHGPEKVNVYLIDIYLPNSVILKARKVVECKKLTDDGACALLIGMDVIRHGDMTISNYDKKTVFSFRMPSQKHTDYVEVARGEQSRRMHLNKGKTPKRKGRK